MMIRAANISRILRKAGFRLRPSDGRNVEGIRARQRGDEVCVLVSWDMPDEELPALVEEMSDVLIRAGYQVDTDVSEDNLFGRIQLSRADS
jgi:hypothetical protein